MGSVTALLRIRIVIVGVAMMVVAAAAGGVFDRQSWSLAIAVGLPTLISIVVRSRRTPVRLILSSAGVAASLFLVVYAEGGRASDAADAVTSGAQRLLTTEWPSPDRPELIGVVALLLAVSTALAGELAGRRRIHLAAWMPVIVAFVTVLALSAPLGERLRWLIPLTLCLAVFATLRPDGDLSERWALLRGERRLIPLVVIAGLVAAAVSIPAALAVRADPRRNDPAAQTAALLDPIESTLALRALDPAIDLHEITARGAAQLPTRWRTAALSDYDGQRWTPALTLRPIGRRLTLDSDSQISLTVSFLDDDLSLVPLPGTPVIVDAPVETDIDRTVVRLTQRRNTAPLAVTAEVAPTLGGAQVGGIATRPVDDSVTSLSEFAATIAGSGTVLEQLRRIESTMRNDWILESDAPGGGLQRTLIERFLRDTRRGTSEQFATSYVLLARSLGVDARVATGFVVPVVPADGTLVLTSADARVWPEVRLADGSGWVALDPVPPEEASDTSPPPEDPAVQTPTAAQPPTAPPPELANDPTTDDETTNDQDTTSQSALQIWVRRVGIGIAALVLPALAGALLILGVKWRRRRRLLLSGSPPGRVAGAWAVATDRLVDAGLTIGASATNGDIASSGVTHARGAEHELQRLATMSSAVTFGLPDRPDLLADDAATCLGALESSMTGARTRSQRLRWRLSLRSLRRSTRSPVTG